jgi:hypothetical protein
MWQENSEKTPNFGFTETITENKELEETENSQEVAQLVNEETKELSELRWSVITFENCAVKGLTYEEAVEWCKKLYKQGLSGLCIVTDEAAERVEK